MRNKMARNIILSIVIIITLILIPFYYFSILIAFCNLAILLAAVTYATRARPRTNAFLVQGLVSFTILVLAVIIIYFWSLSG